MMQKHPNTIIKEFCGKPATTLDNFKSFYRIKYTSRREKDDIIIKNWFKFLSDVEQGDVEINVGLGFIFAFLTGCDHIQCTTIGIW